MADGDDAATPVKQGKQAPAERRAGGDQGKAKANAVAAAQPIRLADRGYIPSPTRNGDAYARALDPGKLQAAILGGMSSATNAPAAAKERRPAAKALVEEDQDTDADEEEHSRHVQNRGTDDEPIRPDKESASKEREDKREFVKALLHQIHVSPRYAAAEVFEGADERLDRTTDQSGVRGRPMESVSVFVDPSGGSWVPPQSSPNPVFLSRHRHPAITLITLSLTITTLTSPRHPTWQTHYHRHHRLWEHDAV